MLLQDTAHGISQIKIYVQDNPRKHFTLNCCHFHPERAIHQLVTAEDVQWKAAGFFEIAAGAADLGSAAAAGEMRQTCHNI